jgi:hypothetical protein
MHRDSANQEGIASALYNSSELLRERRDYAASLAALEESHALYSDLDHQRGLALSCVRIGLVLVESGSADRAGVRINEGMRIARSTGNRHAMLYGMLGLARLAVSERDYESARLLAAQALDLASALDDRMQRAEAVLVAADVTRAREDFVEELRLRYWLEREYQEMGLNQSYHKANSARIERLLQNVALEQAQEARQDSALLDPRVELKSVFS